MCLGTVQEHRFIHKIMVPFGEPGRGRGRPSIQEGEFTVNEPVARIRERGGSGRREPDIVASPGRCDGN